MGGDEKDLKQLVENNLFFCVWANSPACEKAVQLLKRQVPISFFDCIWAAEVLLFALFSVEEIGADCC